MKKRVLALFLASLLSFSMTACGTSPKETPDKTAVDKSKDKNTDSDSSDPVLGGYETPDSPVITDDIQKICEKAFADTSGVSYAPVALIGTQIVAGTNYCILFRMAPVIPDPTETYELGYLYQDLDGNVEVTDIVDSQIETNLSDSDGGWTQPDSPELTEDVSQVFENAVSGLTGVGYTPLALLSTQVVSGTNYRIFCEKTATTQEAESEYCILTVYQDLNGNAEITDVADFTS